MRQKDRSQKEKDRQTDSQTNRSLEREGEIKKLRLEVPSAPKFLIHIEYQRAESLTLCFENWRADGSSNLY